MNIRISFAFVIAACDGSSDGIRGAQGPEGVQGPPGLQGVAGPTGDIGPAGVSAPILVATDPDFNVFKEGDGHDSDGIPNTICVTAQHPFHTNTGRVLVQRADGPDVWLDTHVVAVSGTSLLTTVDIGPGYHSLNIEAGRRPWDYLVGTCASVGHDGCEDHVVGSESRCYCPFGTMCPPVGTVVVTELPALP